MTGFNDGYAIAKCREEVLIRGKGILVAQRTSNCLDTYVDQKIYPGDPAKPWQRILEFFCFGANAAEALSAKGMVFKILVGEPEKLD